MHTKTNTLVSRVAGTGAVLALLSCSGSGLNDDGDAVGSKQQALGEQALPERVAAPVITPGRGTYGAPQTVTIASDTEGSVIYFTVDGRSPHPETAYEYTGPFYLESTTMVKARAYQDGLTQSAMVNARIRIVEDPQEAFDILVVVDEALPPQTAGLLNQYLADVRGRGSSAQVAVWQGGTAYDLRELIRANYVDHGIDGALLVGDLPAAWYEMDSYYHWVWVDGEWQWLPQYHEEFPIDLYLMDMDNVWYDGDQDGMYDAHWPIGLELYVARLMGSPQEIASYLVKNRLYGLLGSPVDKSAYIFKDDTWEYWYPQYTFGLEWLYGENIEICESFACSTKENYLAKLTGGGAEYVYQWIHSDYDYMMILDQGVYEYVVTSDIGEQNHKGALYNLYNCSAARFTEEENMGMAYLMDTDYGLAVTGSTKIGGNYWPYSLHAVLANDGTWGDAFRQWYNDIGWWYDDYFLGMVILGDPTIKLSEETRAQIETTGALAEVYPAPADVAALDEIMRAQGFEDTKGSYADYVAQNPQFFE